MSVLDAIQHSRWEEVLATTADPHDGSLLLAVIKQPDVPCQVVTKLISTETINITDDEHQTALHIAVSNKR